jgi:hypothetical protein
MALDIRQVCDGYDATLNGVTVHFTSKPSEADVKSVVASIAAMPALTPYIDPRDEKVAVLEAAVVTLTAEKVALTTTLKTKDAQIASLVAVAVPITKVK